jgi:hypothetical protein
MPSVSYKSLDQLLIGINDHQIIVVALHPGTVDTDFSRRYHGNVKHKIFSVDECVDHLANVVSSLQLQDSGKYLAFDGEELPW